MWRLSLLRTPLGWMVLSAGLLRRLWPLLARLAGGYRRRVVCRARVVVVVGSFGKTTTTRAIRAALATPARLDAQSNAPPRVALALLGLRPGDRWAVLEVGINGPGQMAGYARMLRPDVVVVTSIGSEHLRSLRSLEATRQEKAEMLRQLGPSGLAVINGDDPHVRWMASQTRARVIACGLGAENAVRATDIVLSWPVGLRCTLHLAGRAFPLQTRLLGRHQLFSILAAAAVGWAEGVPLDRLLARLAATEPVEGRLQPVRLRSGAILLLDDFKGALETYDAAFDLLAEIPAGRRLAVVGDVTEPPGSQGPIYHRLGARLAELCSQVVMVGTQHRRYATGALRAGLPREAIVSVGRDPLRAADLLHDQLGPGDVVLIKGQDAQRLERVALVLAGRDVRCGLALCRLSGRIRCANCPMLERGWTNPDDRRLLLGRLRLGREVTRAARAAAPGKLDADAIVGRTCRPRRQA